MNAPIVHAVMYRDYQIGSLCESRAWGPPMLFSAVTDDVTCPACREKLDGTTTLSMSKGQGQINPNAVADNRPRVRLVVTHTTHQTTYYPVPPDQGWKVNVAMRCLVVGHGIPRTYIPLDSVLWFDLEEIDR